MKNEFVRDQYNNLFDAQTALNIRKLEGDGLITDLYPIGSGKEAHIFYTISRDGLEEALKIHRYSILAFRKMPDYMRARGKKVPNNRALIDLWTSYEFKYLLKSYELGIKVPKPYRQYKNVLIMKFIGEKGIPAPSCAKVKECDYQKAYTELLNALKKMAKAGFTHGDLSKYNVLYWDDNFYIIDFSQAVKITDATKHVLLRDIRNLNSWFSSYITVENEETILKEMGLQL
jgi:RIO kinase 1